MELYGSVPRAFVYYTAPYPYLISPNDLFKLVTHLAFSRGLRKGWTETLYQAVESIPPSYALANPKSNNLDFYRMVTDLFTRAVEDEPYLTSYYAELLGSVNPGNRLNDIIIERRHEFILVFTPILRGEVW